AVGWSNYCEKGNSPREEDASLGEDFAVTLHARSITKDRNNDNRNSYYIQCTYGRNRAQAKEGPHKPEPPNRGWRPSPRCRWPSRSASHDRQRRPHVELRSGSTPVLRFPRRDANALRMDAAG